MLGFSGTNSRYLLIEDSNWFNNGVGLVPNTLDSEPFEPSADSVIRNNDIYWNNFNYFLPNSRVATVSDGLGEVEGFGTIQYPTGVGVVLFGSDGWTVESNNIFGNWKFGVSLASDPTNKGDNAVTNHSTITNNQMGKGGADLNADRLLQPGCRRRQLLLGQHEQHVRLKPGRDRRPALPAVPDHGRDQPGSDGRQPR